MAETKADLEKKVASLERKLSAREKKIEELQAQLSAQQSEPAGDPDRVHGPDAVPIEQR